MTSTLLVYSHTQLTRSGPTQIHSRRHAGPFTAKVFIRLASPALGVARRFQFTEEPIYSKDDLKSVLRCAGQEARRVTDGLDPVR